MDWTKEEAWRWAQEWVDAWNSHDLEQILGHYTEDATLTSPVAQMRLGNPHVQGKEALRAYFSKGLTASPNLHFRLLDVAMGIHSIVLYYENQRGSKTCEWMAVSEDGRVTEVNAHYTEPVE